MAYQVSQLHSYMDVIKSADFSSINAFFIGSSPGSHQGSALSHFGHMAAKSVFRKHDIKVNWPLIIQCSSIGSLGQTPTTWCTSELKQSLGSAKDVQVIYPSKKNVMDSLDGLLGTVHILRSIYIEGGASNLRLINGCFTTISSQICAIYIHIF